VKTPTDKGYDLVARSPKGHIFPIQVKGGSGLLDVSTVVDFGSAVENDVENGAIRKYSRILDPAADVQDVIVKPVIATNKQIADASSDYASTFKIDVVSPPESESPQIIASKDIDREGISQLSQKLVSHLTYWDDRIEIHKQHSQSIRGKALTRKEEDWYRSSSKTSK
jgi:hypothetical protein